MKSGQIGIPLFSVNDEDENKDEDVKYGKIKTTQLQTLSTINKERANWKK